MSDNAPDLRFNEERPFVMSPRNVAVPLWAVVVMIGSFVSGTVALLTTLNNLNGQIGGLRSQLESQWTITDERELGFQVERDNQNFKFPNAYEVHKRTRQ